MWFYWLSLICNNGNGISTIFILNRTLLLAFVCSTRLPQRRDWKRIWAITMLVWMLTFTTVVVMPQRNCKPNTNTCSTTPIGVSFPHSSNLAPTLFIHSTFFTAQPSLIAVSWYHMLALIYGEAVQRRSLYYGWGHGR